MQLVLGVMCEGQLRNSTGAYTKGGLEGVYCFASDKADKAADYAPGAPIFHSRYFVRSVWELSASPDGKGKLGSRDTLGDQKCFREEHVVITALRLIVEDITKVSVHSGRG